MTRGSGVLRVWRRCRLQEFVLQAPRVKDCVILYYMPYYILYTLYYIPYAFLINFLYDFLYTVYYILYLPISGASGFDVGSRPFFEADG